MASSRRYSLGRLFVPFVVLLSVVLSSGTLAASGPKTLTAADAVNGVIYVPDTAGAPVTINGDGQSSVRMWFNSWWVHEFLPNKDGSVTLTEEHASGQKTTMRNVPAVFFANGDGVALPSLKPVDAGSLVSAAGGSGPPGAAKPALIRAPALPKASRPGEIVAVQIRNDTAGDLPSRIVTFGQMFRPGDFPDGDMLAAKDGAKALPVQADIKLLYQDKSVKHAVVSLKVPALPSKESVTVMLSVEHGTAPAAAITPQAILSSGYDLKLIREFAGSSGLPSLSISARALLASGASDGSLTTWLSGPLASEYRVSQRVMPNLVVTFDVRATADDMVMTDVGVANDLAYIFPQASNYSASVVQPGMPVWKTPLLDHRRFEGWHKVFWNRDAPLPSVILDVDYLERTGAIPNYDLSTGLSRAALDQSIAALAKSDTGPLGAALISKAMGTTGGRDDIGPTSAWAANYLVSQDPDARAIMLAQADAAASIPWHVHEIDGRMITAAAHPRLWLDNRCKTVDCVPGAFSDPAGAGWGLDSAHEGDLAYVPYLITGNHFYLDQLQSEANWVILAQDPVYRGDDKGLVYPASQVRGVAWNLRDIANAAWISPDGDPLKAYFEGVLRYNLQGLTQTYLVDRTMRLSGAIEGFIENPYDKASVGPWQQDFLSLVMTQQGLRRSEAAKNFADWMENFVAGRFVHGADGFNPLHGPGYYFVYIDPQSKVPANSWAGIYNLNFSGKPAPTQLDGTPDGNGDYAAVARAATANLFSLTGDPRALSAFAFIVSNTQPMLSAFAKGNTFNINPRFPDGHLLQNDEIQFAPSGGARLSAKGAHSLLIAGNGQATLQAAKGVSILVGGSGPSTLIGAAGINYFLAGTSDTMMAGAAGQNYYQLGTGRAQIDLAVDDAAVDRVEGFKPGRDHVHLIGINIDLGQIVAARKAGAGATTLTVGPGHTIEFAGIAPSDITPAFFN